MIIKALFIFFSIIFINNTYALNPDLKIEGNKRTKTHYIKKLFRKCQERWQNEQIKELEQCLLNSKLFSQVEIRPSKNKITIIAEDRWTLLPIPFARSEKGEKIELIFVYAAK